jgi:biotin carboxyl carrier protein
VAQAMRYFVSVENDQEVELDLRERFEGGYQVQLVEPEADPFELEVVEHETGLLVLANHRVLDVIVDGSPPDMLVYLGGRALSVRVENARRHAAKERRAAHSESGADIVVSPMPGKVVKVLVEEGSSVEKGAALLVVEAMKMENEVCSERAGTVAQVFVKNGDAVEAGARLVAVS